MAHREAAEKGAQCRRQPDQARQVDNGPAAGGLRVIPGPAALRAVRGTRPARAAGSLRLLPRGAAALNIAVTQPQQAGYLTVFPCGQEMPLASNLNFAAGQTIANHVTAQLGAHGAVCVYTSSTTHLVVDVEGVYRRPV